MKITSVGFLSLRIILFIATCSGISSCAQPSKEKIPSPTGYNLSAPKKFNMPEVLEEISGIAFHKGNPAIVYAQQDEEGKVFWGNMESKKFQSSKFAKNGDFEDITTLGDMLILLKSNGDLYSFPIAEVQKKHAAGVTETKGLLPKGEYEGLFADEKAGLIYVLCKECKTDKNKKSTTGYTLNMDQSGYLKNVGTFQVDVSGVDKLAGRKKGTFHPSALAKHPFTNEWYMVSAINKALLVADGNFKVKAAYHLTADLFNQPEGIAFDKNGNLYISNEGGDVQFGNILKFSYQKPGKKP